MVKILSKSESERFFVINKPIVTWTKKYKGKK